jgi:hypothetical protein
MLEQCEKLIIHIFGSNKFLELFTNFMDLKDIEMRAVFFFSFLDVISLTLKFEYQNSFTDA